MTQHKNKALLWLIVGIICIMSLSYFREGFFLSLNGVILGSPSSNAYFDILLPYFNNMDLHFLITLKWVGTTVFSLLFIMVTLFFIYKIVVTKKIVKVLGILYLILVSFSIIVGAVGYVLHRFDKVYFVVREIFGFIQSPLPFFLAVPLFYFVQFNKKETD